MAALAQAHRVMEARRSGVFISLFQASQHVSTMALLHGPGEGRRSSLREREVIDLALIVLT
jgi:hypothetical protein